VNSFHVPSSARRRRTRNSHAAIFSCALHCLLYVVLSLEWMQRVPVIDVAPLLDDATFEVSFVSLDATEPVAVTMEAAAPAVAQMPQPVATPPRLAPLPPEPTVETQPDPPSDPPPAVEPEAVPEPPVEPTPKPPPAVVTTPTTAELLRPEEPLAEPIKPAATVEVVAEEQPAPVEPGSADQSESAVGPPADDTGEAVASEGAGSAAPQAPLTPDEQRHEQIGQAMSGIARAAAGGSASRAVDIVFLLDLSGSMENNLRALGQNLAGMMAELQSRDTDATFGIVKFKRALFVLFPQTTDVEAYERLLQNLSVGGDEHALDAMDRAATKVKFRPAVQRRFVLITDEPLKGDPPLAQLLTRLISENIVVDVIGLNIPEHRILARRTGGTWHRIPGDRS
jgi:outer membrane biosynthesis protein TonB